MTRALFLLVLVGCSGDSPTIGSISSRFTAQTFKDVGDVSVGETVLFTVDLSSEFGRGELYQVDVLNLDDETFAWAGDPLSIANGETAEVAFSYTPQRASNDRAVVTFLLRGDGEDEGAVETTLRGRGVPLNVSRWPSVVDFGPVPITRSSTREVSVANDGLLDVDITDIDMDGSGFTVDQQSELPLTIRAGDVIELDVRYTAVDTLPSDGDLDIVLQDGTILSTVQVRANDCAAGSAALYDADADGWTSCAGDCDDTRATVYPGAPELADGHDNDCDGLSDEGTADYDDDGDGFTERQGDCNDSAFLINPGRTEIMGDGIDNDCDGVADLGSDDVDGDGYSPAAGDCDDRSNTVHPGAQERADGTDNDCDGDVDEGTRLADDDGDGFCESVQDACSDGAAGGDCADGSGLMSAMVYPGAVELPDGLDNDCDGEVDEGTTRGDDDGDGFSEEGGDCNDANANIHPGRFEVPGNGIDDDCDAGTLD
mgnify:CR=1 FL=1